MGKRIITDARRQYQAERKRKAVEAGLCNVCLKAPATEGPNGGTKTCDRCRAIKRIAPSRVQQAKDRADTYAERRANAKCGYCGADADLGPRGGKNMCNPCRQKLYAVRSSRKKKVQAVAAYGGRCMDCGVADIRVLDFHHVNFDGNSEREEHGKGTMEVIRRIARSGPVDGIVMLCANCHRIRHWNQRWSPDLFS